ELGAAFAELAPPRGLGAAGDERLSAEQVGAVPPKAVPPVGWPLGAEAPGEPLQRSALLPRQSAPSHTEPLRPSLAPRSSPSHGEALRPSPAPRAPANTETNATVGLASSVRRVGRARWVAGVAAALAAGLGFWALGARRLERRVDVE